MEQYIIYIIIGAVLLIVLILFIATSGKRRRNKAYLKIQSEFGGLPDREYTEEELLKIRSYYDRVHAQDAFSIDDITWNDLDMDEIFATLNTTYSSVGEEELYRILREPVFDQAELNERDRVIRFFQDHPKERTALQYEYALIGRTRRVSLADYLYRFRELNIQSIAMHLFPMILIVLSVALCFFNVMFGIIAVLFTIITNLTLYYKIKAKIEPWYVSLSAMAYLVNAAYRISKESTPELESYYQKLREEVKPVLSLRRDVAWLGGSGKGVLSMTIAEILMDYFRMMTHFDFIKFNHMVRSVRKNETHILEIMHILGYLESMIAVASMRAVLPFYTVGEFGEEKARLELHDGYHPLLRNPVANSITVERPVLLTGSNASGKSTFLRMTALCVLFGETIATVPAHSLKASFFRVFSSMALSDDLQKGESYFIVEIKSLKRIMDALSGEVPVLSFVDEVLRGTNTVERISASSEILKKFAETGSMIFAATHDIELTGLLEPWYENYHFEEQVEGNEVHFDFILRKGKATTRNAIKLLNMMGYEEGVIRKAEETAERFVREGKWELS